MHDNIISDMEFGPFESVLCRSFTTNGVKTYLVFDQNIQLTNEMESTAQCELDFEIEQFLQVTEILQVCIEKIVLNPMLLSFEQIDKHHHDSKIFHDLIVLNVISNVSSRQFLEMQKINILWNAMRTLLTKSRYKRIVSVQQMELFLIAALPENDDSRLTIYREYLEQAPIHIRGFFALIFISFDILQAADLLISKSFLAELTSMLLAEPGALRADSAAAASSSSTSWSTTLSKSVLAMLIYAGYQSTALTEMKLAIGTKLGIPERQLSLFRDHASSVSKAAIFGLLGLDIPTFSDVSTKTGQRILSPSHHKVNRTRRFQSPTAPYPAVLARKKISLSSHSNSPILPTTSTTVSLLDHSALSNLFDRSLIAAGLADTVSLVAYLRRTKAPNALPLAVLLQHTFLSGICRVSEISLDDFLSLASKVGEMDQAFVENFNFLSVDSSLPTEKDDFEEIDGFVEYKLEDEDADVAAIDSNADLSQTSSCSSSHVDVRDRGTRDRARDDDDDDDELYQDDAQSNPLLGGEELFAETADNKVVHSSSLEDVASPGCTPASTASFSCDDLDESPPLSDGTDTTSDSNSAILEDNFRASGILMLDSVHIPSDDQIDDAQFLPAESDSPKFKDLSKFHSPTLVTESAPANSSPIEVCHGSSVFHSVDLGQRDPDSEAEAISGDEVGNIAETPSHTPTQPPKLPKPAINNNIAANPFLSPSARFAASAMASTPKASDSALEQRGEILLISKAAMQNQSSSIMTDVQPSMRRDGTGISAKLRSLFEPRKKDSSVVSAPASKTSPTADSASALSAAFERAAKLRQSGPSDANVPISVSGANQRNVHYSQIAAFIKAGPLLRLSSKGMWVSRYLVLHNNATPGSSPVLSLYGYAVQSAWGLLPCDLKATFSVSIIQHVSVDSRGSKKGKQFCISCFYTAPPAASLVGPHLASIGRATMDKQSWTFKCSAAEDRMDWVTHIEAARNKYVE